MAENSPAIAASATPSLTTTMATTTYYILTVLYYIYIVLRTFYKKAESATALYIAQAEYAAQQPAATQSCVSRAEF